MRRSISCVASWCALIAVCSTLQLQLAGAPDVVAAGAAAAAVGVDTAGAAAPPLPQRRHRRLHEPIPPDDAARIDDGGGSSGGSSSGGGGSASVGRRRARPHDGRCVGTVGGWCGSFYAQRALVPYRQPPVLGKRCPRDCSGVGVCHGDRGVCDCPAGEKEREQQRARGILQGVY